MVIAKLNQVKKNASEELKNIFGEIKSKDWLYYNNEVRFEFVRRTIDFFDETHWQGFEIDGDNKFPFGININEISKQMVAYLQSKDDLFISVAYGNLRKTKLYKSQIRNFKNISSVHELRSKKEWFLSHFYDYEKVKGYDNLFYDKRLGTKAKISEEILENTMALPKLAGIELKLKEVDWNCTNADSDVVKQISARFEEHVEEVIVPHNAGKQDDFIKEIEFEYEEIDDTDENAVNYKSKTGGFVGYKI
jgi:hypothetical protein